jgi:hypothetical protein
MRNLQRNLHNNFEGNMTMGAVINSWELLTKCQTFTPSSQIPSDYKLCVMTLNVCTLNPKKTQHVCEEQG